MNYDNDQCWQIFIQKDQSYDGVFVVGVMSTKIYCRPSCSARPLRKNVRFFADNTSAEQAGLRPCKRCTPNRMPPDLALCHKVCRYIESQPTSPSLTQIAHNIGYSPFHLQRTFKHVMGISPFGYAQAIKWLRLQRYMTTHSSVHEAISKAGFGSVSSYYHAHAQRRQLHARQHAATLSFGRCTYHDFVVIGAFKETQPIYCGIYADNATAELAMQQLFGQSLSAVNAVHSNVLHALVTAQNLGVVAPAIAKDIRATVFQQRVWQAIRQIPLGQTRHYHEIATAIGQPDATRAVANACAQNPLAIITPCHRVVPADNTIGGYRWGADIKAQLFIAEQTSTYNGGTNAQKENEPCDQSQL
jgi:AraC family transcriptional regulator of adaptative response/methylated-DNA-[protein]-cysteine methyltransferase